MQKVTQLHDVFEVAKSPYRSKIIITDTVIQYYTYEKYIYRDRSSNKACYDKSNEGIKGDYSLQRARSNLFLTIAANVGRYSKFITLTTKEIVLNRNEFLKMFNQFTKNFYRIFGYKLKYVAVLERQKLRGLKENNLGSWHIHIVAFNESKLNYEKLKTAWCFYGSIDIKRLRDYTHIPVYLMKYLTKEVVNINNKAIIKSHHLKKPVVIYDINEFHIPFDCDFKNEYYLPDDTKVYFYEKQINRSIKIDKQQHLTLEF
jgi:hypothetical protein